MTEPPRDGYGSPRYRGQRPPPPPVPQEPPPQQLQPRQPPPQPPTAGFGYWDSPSRQPPPPPPPQPPLPPQPPWEPRPYGYDDPYDEEPPAAYGYVPGPMGPQRAERSKTKLVMLLAGSILALLLAAGGVYYMVESEAGGGGTGANSQQAPAGPDSAGERPGEGEPGGAQDGEDAGSPGNEADRRAFAGRWRSDGGETLTIGAKERPGSAGKQTVSYDRPGRLSTCPGVGEVRRSGAALRLALRCVNGDAESELAGDAVRSRDRLTVEWDGGSRDAFARQDGRDEADSR